MVPHPPFDHPHHRRAAHPVGHHYLDQHPGHHHHNHHHNHHMAGGGGGGGGGGGAAPARSRYDYEYDSRPIQYPPPDHHHHNHLPRGVHQQQPPPPPPPLPLPPPPPPPPQHRHDGPLPFRPTPETYSPPPYHNPPPPPHQPYHQHRHGGGGDFRAADEIRRIPSHHPHHHHHQQPPPQLPHQQPQLSWEEVEEERRYGAHQLKPPLSWEEAEEERRYAPHQLRASLSPPGARKRYRCAMHDSGDLESTSSSGPPPRRQRQQLHSSYSPPPEDSFVDRATSYSCYNSHEGFATHSDGNGNRKMPMPMSAMLPGSPRRPPQKTAPMRLSVWHRIEENPSLYTPPSPRRVSKDVHVSPSKTKNSGSASRELASVISLDCKAKSSDGKDSGDSAGMKKNAAKKTDKVLSSVLVKPSPEAKEKQRAVNKVTKKPDKADNNIPGFTSAGVRSVAFPGAGVKKVKKIVIKKIVRKISAKDKQSSSSAVSEKDNIDANVNAPEKEEANANASEKEEGEITTSSFEKDSISAHNLVSTDDTAGVANSVEVQKEQNNDLVNLRKSNAASTTASMDTLDTASASTRKYPGKEDYKSFVNSIDGNASPAIESTKTFNTSGVEHGKEDDRCFINSSVKNATLHCENNNSQQEEEGEILSVSGPVNVASDCPRILDAVEPHDCEVENMEENKDPEVLSGNSAVYVNGAKDCTTEVSGGENDRTEEGLFLLNDPMRTHSIDEVSMIPSKDSHEKEGMILIGASEVCAASVDQPEGNPKIVEAAVTHGSHKEEGSLLNNPIEKDVISFGSWGAVNTTEISVNEITKEKEWIMPIEPNEATSFAHHVKALTTLEINGSENIQKESQMPMDSIAFQTIQCAEAPNTVELVSSKFVQNEAGKIPIDLNGTDVGTSDNSLYTPEFAVAGGTEDSSMQDLLHDAKAALNKPALPLEVVDKYIYDLRSSRGTESTILPSLDDGPMKDSSDAVILNNGVGRSTSSQVPELTYTRRPHLPPDYNPFSLHSHDSQSVSGSSEYFVPTALTLGNNIYFSTAESEGQPEENHNLVDVNQGFDVTMTEFGNIVKRKGGSGIDFMNEGGQNWLTLPLTVSCLDNGATGSTERLGLEQIVDEGACVCQDHDNMPDIDQCGSIDVLSGQDNSLKLCGISMPQADLLATEERNKNVENEIVLTGSVNSVNVLDQYSYRTVDKPIDNPNKPILLSSQSADAPGQELASSQVSVDSDHTYHGSTEDHVGVSSTTPDSISSWIEAIVSEAKKEHHQSCKSSVLGSPDKVSGPKEDSRKALSDSIVNSVVKSPPRINIASSTVSKVPTKQVALSGSLREPPRLNQNARNRTWRRDNVSSSNASLHVSQTSGLPPKLPVKKISKSQNSYIRKGNALIRNPTTGNHLHSSSSLDSQNKLSKPVIMRRSMNFVRKVDSKDVVAHSHAAVERPKTPPLPLHTKSISCAVNVLEPLSQSLQQQVLETEKEDFSGQVNSGADNPSIISLHKSEALDAGKAIYVRPVLNQLAAQGQHLGDSSNISMDNDKVMSLQPSAKSDLYFKKKKHQIILGPSTSDAPNSKDTSQAEILKSGESKVLMSASLNNNITVAKDRPHKALQTTNTVRSSSHVWTLSGQNPRKKSFMGASHMKFFPGILPWKRKTLCQNFRGSYPSLLNTSSIGIMRKLLQTRNRSTIYTVSNDGFSLRKSGVLSIGGSSLKWSRSLEKHSQKVNEEATQAVAEVERKKREKRKRQSLRNKGRNDGYSASVAANQLTNNRRASSHSRVSSTCNEYVRVNKGNQLVRNPKKVIRMLASEKIRWSLHTVRTRLAKKKQYCQFFTRFGECKKSGGKCPYIHDRAKVAICTKFLNGWCSSTSCKLTHKVLPERMPDCSYFLQGLCTNTACPYRHVKVNSNAPVCEDFLKGYCADGDECRKKHSYVCPVFEATGECPQESKCKLHHPKKKNKSKRSKVDTVQNNSWGRYFETSIGHGSGARIVSLEEEERQKPEQVSGEDFADFIELGANIEVLEDADASDDIQLMELDSENLEMQTDNLEALIKPLRIMRTARV